MIDDYYKKKKKVFIHKIDGTHFRIGKKDFGNVSRYIISTTGRTFSALSIAKYLKDSLHGNNYSTLSQYTNNGWTINQMIAFSD